MKSEAKKTAIFLKYSAPFALELRRKKATFAA